MPTPTLPRREFLRAGGSLVVTFSLAGLLPRAAFADGSPKTVPMYPKSRDELFGAAQAIKTAIDQEHIYDSYGPMVVYNELFEGAAVIESQPYTVPASQYHGFGLDRLAIVKQFFGP